MSNERLPELIEVQAHFGLPTPALVEKDFYVVKALALIAAIDTTPLRLVFGGGPALSRAHRLVRRMSEDIDLRIVGDKQPGRGALRRLRDAVTQTLLGQGSNSIRMTLRSDDRVTRAAIRFTGCHTSRRWKGRGLCAPRSRSKLRSGR